MHEDEGAIDQLFIPKGHRGQAQSRQDRSGVGGGGKEDFSRNCD